MQNIAKSHGVGVRKLCEMAGIAWQSYYRKRNNEGLVRLTEYDALAAAVERIEAEGKHGLPGQG